MKTAMQEVFEKHDEEFNKMNFLKWFSDNRERLLQAEKEQIKSAYGAGAMDASYDFDNVDSEQYYQQTYNQE